jgi:hypothetical protein
MRSLRSNRGGGGHSTGQGAASRRTSHPVSSASANPARSRTSTSEPARHEHVGDRWRGRSDPSAAYAWRFPPVMLMPDVAIRRGRTRDRRKPRSSPEPPARGCRWRRPQHREHSGTDEEDDDEGVDPNATRGRRDVTRASPGWKVRAHPGHGLKPPRRPAGCDERIGNVRRQVHFQRLRPCK